MLAPFFALALAASPVEPPLHHFNELALAPDGQRVASVEHDERPGQPNVNELVIRSRDGKATMTLALPCAGVEGCNASGLAWSRDSAQLAFVLHDPRGEKYALETIASDGTNLHTILNFAGTLDSPSWSPDDRSLAVLATPGAEKAVGAT